MNHNQNHAEQLPPGMTQAVWATLDPEVRAALLGAPNNTVIASDAVPPGRNVPQHYPHDQDDIEAVIERDDLLHKIRDRIGAAESFHDSSLWVLLEEFAQPLSLQQSAVLYTLEELYGEHVINNVGEYLVHFSLTGASIWIDEKKPVS